MRDLSKKPYIKWIRSFFWRYRFGFFCGVFFAVLLGVVTGVLGLLIGPALQILMQQDAESHIAVTDLFAGRTLQYVQILYTEESISRQKMMTWMPSALCFVAGVRMVTSVAQWYFIESSAEKAIRDLRLSLVRDYLQSSPYSRRRAEHPVPQLSSFISHEIQVMKETYAKIYGGIPREFFQVVFLLFVLFELSPTLFLWFFVLLGPSMAWLHRLGKRLKKKTKHALSDYSDLSEWLQTRLLGIETIKHYHTEAQEVENMEAQNQQVLRKFLNASRIRSRISPLLEMSGVVALSLTLVIAMQQMKNGELSGATASSFFASLVLMSQCLLRLSRYYTSYREGAACEQRVGEVYLQIKALQGGHQQAVLGPLGSFALLIESAKFRYPGQDQDALQPLRLFFPKGAITCLKGPSGAGKSTFVRMILGLEPCKRWLTKGPIGYLPQQVQLFHGSIADNLCWPEVYRPEMRDRVEQALSEVCLAKSLDESSQSLSGGESQRVLLARLFFHRYPCLLIDEGTSALDPTTEKVIADGLRRLAQSGTTVIMVAHREQTLALADYVIELESGCLKRDSVRQAFSSEWERLQTSLQQPHMSQP